MQLFETKPVIVVIGVIGMEMINKIKERPSTSYYMAQRFRRTTLSLSGSPDRLCIAAAMDDIVICLWVAVSIDSRCSESDRMPFQLE